MARAIWNGEISFGLINIQVELYSALRRSKIDFHLMDRKDKSRVRYQRINEDTGEEVPWSDIAKGYEYKDGNYILVEDEELKEIKPELTKTIDLEEFVDLAQVPVILFDKPYYLVPNKRSKKSYVLLREVLKQENKAGIGKVVIRAKEHIAILFPEEDALVMNLMLFPQEIRPLTDFSFPELSEVEDKIKSKEIELSTQLIESMSADWDPDKYKDEYKLALQEWIEKKSKAAEKGKKVPTPSKQSTTDDSDDNVINIEELLQKSLKTRRNKKTSATSSSKAKKRRGS